MNTRVFRLFLERLFEPLPTGRYSTESAPITSPQKTKEHNNKLPDQLSLLLVSILSFDAAQNGALCTDVWLVMSAKLLRNVPFYGL